MQHRLDILLLPDGLGLDRAAFGGDAQHIPRQLGDLRLFSRPDQADHIAHILLPDGLTPGGERQQSLNGLAGQHGIFRLAIHPQLSIPVHHAHAELLLQKAHVHVKGPKDIHGLLQPLNADSLFQICFTPVCLGCYASGCSSVKIGTCCPISSWHSAVRTAVPSRDRTVKRVDFTVPYGSTRL